MSDYTTPPPPPPPPPPGPPGGVPPYDPSGGAGYGAPQSPSNGMGIAALVLGIVSIVLCCLLAGLWAGIPAIVLGFLGMKKADQGLATNKPLALTGLILGGVGLLFFVIQIILFATGNQKFGEMPTR